MWTNKQSEKTLGCKSTKKRKRKTSPLSITFPIVVRHFSSFDSFFSFLFLLLDRINSFVSRTRYRFNVFFILHFRQSYVRLLLRSSWPWLCLFIDSTTIDSICIGRLLSLIRASVVFSPSACVYSFFALFYPITFVFFFRFVTSTWRALFARFESIKRNLVANRHALVSPLTDHSLPSFFCLFIRYLVGFFRIFPPPSLSLSLSPSCIFPNYLSSSSPNILLLLLLTSFLVIVFARCN